MTNFFIRQNFVKPDADLQWLGCLRWNLVLFGRSLWTQRRQAQKCKRLHNPGKWFSIRSMWQINLRMNDTNLHSDELLMRIHFTSNDGSTTSTQSMMKPLQDALRRRPQMRWWIMSNIRATGGPACGLKRNYFSWRFRKRLVNLREWFPASIRMARPTMDRAATRCTRTWWHYRLSPSKEPKKRV